MERRNLDFHDFNSVVDDIDQLHKRGYTKAGQWDLSQICEHLAKVMRLSIEGFGFKGAWYIRALAPLIKRRFFKTRRMPTGFQAPGVLMPRNLGEEAQAVASCKEQLDRVRNYPGEFQPSPFFGRLSPEEWRQLHLIHAAHHLSFLIPNA
jgi:hypothetical protein